MNSENGSTDDQYISELHSCAAEGNVEGILTALEGTKLLMKSNCQNKIIYADTVQSGDVQNGF